MQVHRDNMKQPSFEHARRLWEYFDLYNPEAGLEGPEPDSVVFFFPKWLKPLQTI